MTDNAERGRELCSRGVAVGLSIAFCEPACSAFKMVESRTDHWRSDFVVEDCSGYICSRWVCYPFVCGAIEFSFIIALCGKVGRLLTSLTRGRNSLAHGLFGVMYPR